MKYLFFKPFVAGPCGDQIALDKRLEEYPFLLYGGHFIGHHARSSHLEPAKEMLSFLLDPVLLASFTQFRYYRNRKDELPTGQSALQNACGLGLIKTTIALLKIGEDVSAADDQGWTPLHSAASYGQYEILQLLIDHDALIEKRDNQGWTSLCWARSKVMLRLCACCSKTKLVPQRKISQIGHQYTRPHTGATRE